MTESSSNISKKAGLAPGSLIHIGDVFETDTRISVIDYNQETITEKPVQSIDEILEYKKSKTITWVIVEGLSNINLIERIGQIFNIHQLVLEDILNTHQRAKFEAHDDYLYTVLKSLKLEKDQFALSYEQVSILTLSKFVFVFKEKRDEIFNPLIKRLKTSKGAFRSLGSDYLTYTLLDTIVDQYFIILDTLDDSINSLEDNLLSPDSKQGDLKHIQRLKRELIHFRRIVSPVRELIADMLRSESNLIHDKTLIFLRDVADHAIRVVESIETYRDLLTGLLDIYISVVNNKMNEIMKVLTVFASIFIPLTFITGIYGMNFDYMPELKWKWAYPLVWLMFLAIPIALAFYFKRKKWL